MGSCLFFHTSVIWFDRAALNIQEKSETLCEQRQTWGTAEMVNIIQIQLFNIFMQKQTTGHSIIPRVSELVIFVQFKFCYVYSMSRMKSTKMRGL